MSITSRETRRKLEARGWELLEESATREWWHFKYGSVFLHDDDVPHGYGELKALCEFAIIAGIQPQGYVLTEACARDRGKDT